jgi:endonuclease/exonuclease/phosphatase (EEP) superfamily protein YafD
MTSDSSAEIGPPAAQAPNARARRKRRVGTFVALLALVYLAAVLGVAIALPVLGDRWWPFTLILFGPRWALALPLLVLAPAALALHRRSLIPLAAAGIVVVGPILGLVLPLGSLVQEERAGHLRVVTFNIGRVRRDPSALKSFVGAVRPDVLALQECGGNAAQLAQAFPGWSVHVESGMCLVSRHPIRAVESRDPRDVWQRGGSGAIVRATIEILPGTAPGAPETITLVSLHLETVRDAIEALVHGAWRGAAEHDRNVELRAWESSLAREWVDAAAHPVVIVGDFNMPVDSAIYGRFWGGFENAFSRAGVGFGATKRTRWFGVRIDHILAGRGWTAERAWVGPDLGSDHLPLVAELRWLGL